jgi:molybdopterin-guanine dinucleotide biosynthesis protein A
MGGVDKGLVELDGRPMVAHVLARLAPQVDEVLINANQNGDRYGAFGYPVVADAVGGFAGPLAGLHAGMTRATRELVVTVPCDSPFFPEDLVARLAHALASRGGALAVAKTFDQPHPVFCLARRDLLPHLTAFLGSGGRKIDLWYSTLDVTGRSTTGRRVSQHQHRRRAGRRRSRLIAMCRGVTARVPVTIMAATNIFEPPTTEREGHR